MSVDTVEHASATPETVTSRISRKLTSRRRFLRWASTGTVATGIGLLFPGSAYASHCEYSPWCCGNCNAGCPSGCSTDAQWQYCSGGCLQRCTLCTCWWIGGNGWCHCGWSRTHIPCQPYQGPCNCPV